MQTFHPGIMWLYFSKTHHVGAALMASAALAKPGIEPHNGAPVPDMRCASESSSNVHGVMKLEVGHSQRYC